MPSDEASATPSRESKRRRDLSTDRASGDEAAARFEALARRLVRVPKDELDRKRAEEKAHKS